MGVFSRLAGLHSDVFLSLYVSLELSVLISGGVMPGLALLKRHRIGRW
jgi:hypothetical protein